MSLFLKNNKHINYCIIVVAIIILYLLTTLFISFFSVKKYSYHFDDTISKKYTFTVSSFFKNYCLQEKLFVVGSAAYNNFSFINSVTCMQKASGIVDVFISSKVPFIRVSKNQVMTTDGLVVNKNCFSKKSLTNKAQCFIAGIGDNECSVLPSCLHDLKKIPELLYEKYNICWQNFVKIILQDKKQKNFFIIFNGQTVPNQNLMQACNKVRDNLEQDKSFDKKQWVADVRFDNQIIVSSGREVGYGKSFY